MQYDFGPFRLDTTTQQLWRGGHLIPLQPRPLAVLAYLLVHAGEVVSSTALLTEVWRPTRVGKAAVKVCIRAIREALEDDAAMPRYIETVGRVGYRFIAAVVSSQHSVDSRGEESQKAKVEFFPPAPNTQSPALLLVGRDAELAHLHRVLRQTRQGARQAVFVTGEPGIGKTTLVDAFLRTLDASVRVGRGQCLEQYGEGEAYLPVLEALGQLCRGSDGQQVLAVLRQTAPTWMVQMPQFVSEEEVTALHAKVLGTTPARMLREMAEALEVLTYHHALVLVIEDLQWSDRSTLDLLAYLAQRRGRAQLCVVVTHRPVEAISEFPLARLQNALWRHGHGIELSLARLTENVVAAYLQRRFAGQSLPGELAKWIFRRSEGHALFMVALVDYYEREGQMIDETVPDTVLQMITRQLTYLTAEQQQVVEGASIAGVEFGSAMVAALDVESGVVDAVCTELSRRGQLIRAMGVVEWPDGTLSGRYRFCHALYHQVAYQRVPEIRQVRLHRQLGERLEAGYRERARERAAELAMHFERGRAIEKAVHYYHLAGENALQRSTHQEAVLQFTKGMGLAETLPQSPARLTWQLSLQTMLASALMALKGHTSVDAEQAYLRAQALCEEAGDTQRLFFVRLGLFRFYNTRGAYRQAYEYATRCLTQATVYPDATLLMGAHYALGINAFYQGRLAEAQAQTAQGIASYTSAQHETYAREYGFNPVVGCLLIGAATLWLQGYPDQAQHQIGKALQTAQEQPHPFTLIYTHFVAAICAQLLRQEEEVATQAQAGTILATQYGFLVWLALATFFLGWSQSAHGEVQSGIQQMRSGLASLQEIGIANHQAQYLTLLAETVSMTGDNAQALQLIEQALSHIDQSGERFYKAEVWRIKGELTFQSSVRNLESRVKEAEAYFRKSIEIAQRQSAKSWELRAATSLARLWQQQGKTAEARDLLAPVYNWFTEGFDTADLKDAKALLDKLGEDARSSTKLSIGS